MIDAIIFDFDGTLYDSFDEISLAFSKATEKVLGKSVNLDRTDIGPKLEEIFFKKTGLSNSKYKTFELEFREIYDNTYSGTGQLYEGVSGLLSTGKEKSIMQFVISNKPDPVLKRIINKHNIYGAFTEIIGSNSASSTNKKQELTKLLDRHFIGSNIMVVGDTIEDYDMAVINNCQFIHAAYGYGKVEVYNIKKAHSVVQLKDYLFS
jgi:phosphoglycolate phosphatase